MKKKKQNFVLLTTSIRGMGLAYWLKHCTTSRTVPGSIPGDVTGIFIDIFPSDRTIDLGRLSP